MTATATRTDTRLHVADQLRAAGYHVNLLNTLVLVQRFGRRTCPREVAAALDALDIVPAALTPYADAVVVRLAA